jgi:hypothetical protein
VNHKVVNTVSLDCVFSESKNKKTTSGFHMVYLLIPLPSTFLMLSIGTPLSGSTSVNGKRDVTRPQQFFEKLRLCVT